jgi:hypothetical protein
LVCGLDQLHDFIRKGECNLFCLCETACFDVSFFQGGNLFIFHADQTDDPAGLPTPEEPEERAAFLWDELVEQAREDWRTFSFFHSE